MISRRLVLEPVVRWVGCVNLSIAAPVYTRQSGIAPGSRIGNLSYAGSECNPRWSRPGPDQPLTAGTSYRVNTRRLQVLGRRLIAGSGPLTRSSSLGYNEPVTTRHLTECHSCQSCWLAHQLTTHGSRCRNSTSSDWNREYQGLGIEPDLRASSFL